MKKLLKKFVILIGIIITASLTFNITSPDSVSAAGRSLGSCPNFLGMTSWDCGISSMSSESDLTNNIVKIASNILTDITVIAAYLILAYIIYGGYLYMFSSGDTGKAMAGKKALQHAFIGLAIVGSAYAIFSAIRIATIGDASLGDCNPTSGTVCADGGTLVTNLIQWFIGMGGVVSVIFIVVGGWGYMTASGDPSKLTKAKNTIMYAIIGLIIVALAEVLTAFISGLIRDANEDATSNLDSQISINVNKEDHEII